MYNVYNGVCYRRLEEEGRQGPGEGLNGLLAAPAGTEPASQGVTRESPG
jgi:hypothetical protein